MTGPRKIAVVVSKITTINELVKRFEFQSIDGGLLPAFSGGAHTVLEMVDSDVVRMNPYSLMSDPTDLANYAISVRRDDEGRGGSLFLHEKVKVGDRLKISSPTNLFSLNLSAKKHLLLAGGIGITPFLAQIKQLELIGGCWELHYSSRSQQLASYASELTSLYPANVNLYYDDHGQRVDIDALLDRQPLGTDLYICGPKGMIDWARKAARVNGWPTDTTHFEEFLSPRPGKPFRVKLAASDTTIEVGEQESLLEAIERVGVDAPYLCRGGACGHCETNVIHSVGEFVHRDHWLDDAEHASGEKIMPCVSRFEGETLILDR